MVSSSYANSWQEMTPTAPVLTPTSDTTVFGKRFVLMNDNILELGDQAEAKVFLSLEPYRADFTIRDIKLSSDNQWVYVVEGTSQPKFALGESQLRQINVVTDDTTILCKRNGQVASIFSVEEQYMLVVGYGHPRDTLLSVVSLVELESKKCVDTYPEDAAGSFIKPKWVDANSFLSVETVGQLLEVQLPNLDEKTVFTDWWIDDYEAIPGTRETLMAGAPKSEADYFGHKTRFARLNLDTLDLKELSYIPPQAGTLNVAPNGRYFIYLMYSMTTLETSALVYELATGNIKQSLENFTDLDWSTSGRYLVITTNDRFIQYDMETGETIDLGPANGAVLLKVDY
jgi:WD40 repeat protein